MLDQINYSELFREMHPNFFEEKRIREIQPEFVYEEMILPLEGFHIETFSPICGDEASFGYFEGSREELLRTVGIVEEGWPPFFGADGKVYGGFVDGRLVSFCLVEDMGRYKMGGREIKIGGPGCVGTLPEFRCRGIGLAMVARVTEILKQQGYDYSYIHYTGVAPWYAKLGYETVLKWNCRGILG